MLNIFLNVYSQTKLVKQLKCWLKYNNNKCIYKSMYVIEL